MKKVITITVLAFCVQGFSGKTEKPVVQKVGNSCYYDLECGIGNMCYKANSYDLKGICVKKRR